MMYRTNKEYRIFLAYEYAEKENFKYVLPKNPAYKSIGGSNMVKEDSSVAESGTLGSSSKVDILGVVWGLGIVKNKEVYNYISTAADTNGIIDWTNTNMAAILGERNTRLALSTIDSRARRQSSRYLERRVRGPYGNCHN